MRVIMTEHIYKRASKCQAQDDLSDGSFGLLKNLYSTVNIYRYVQKIIEMHILQIQVKIYN